ncbi:MAG: 5-(carboxyamino)imidazole ribonucleotide synthase [candidate division KSB1 bacterium]|nr:5-(carboxyamino)imidazole ribonucleotide synthase [candidate division KSB1 bacterium]MDZ7274700.1 5-(carboxyamino)imidazole ribonucleotide synthase [candidate division KSB1 bacterium]MDZ7285525.1 5-(carboxyamino)imidazole ribonucleotide synthase [candidate division KSB1 bacterium]MDZ7298557.1 5-(carboxyamino)imidazole ribonucleotide synthase [candidate division KSB1 bacterium]MDZ7306591.1 5-(carboxyamino)imidazole ribonucleotide synthase [candidate division KSB1 bacterium]
MKHIILPGATIGILGSGQLGRMLALAARRMGYRVHTLSLDTDSPTGQIADHELVAAYDDLDAVRDFVRRVNVVTFEFENISAEAVEIAAAHVPAHPSARVLHITQNRLREKSFLTSAGLPVVPFQPVQSLEDLRLALQQVGLPAVLKTAGFGYDGKGQSQITSLEQAAVALHLLAGEEGILEAFIDFEKEVSVVAARGQDGAFVHYGVIENRHRNHILDVSLAPAAVSPRVAQEAVAMTRAILDQLQVVGVLCVEFFLTRDEKLYVNELAPRPHNSGHLTIEATLTSQFEQQVRAVCGLPLGATDQLRPAAMANLLGDLWENGEPDWAAGAAFPEVKLHLYGKLGARLDRKMGHLTALADSVEKAQERVCAARQALARKSAAR